jgi:hypothetical protein
MLRKVRRFYSDLPKYSKNRDISMRLQGAVSKAMRSSYYELEGNFLEFEDVFKKHLLAAFVDLRITEKAKRSGRVGECFDVAERITKELWMELKDIDKREVWKFFEFFIKLHEVKRSNVEL